MSGSVIAAAPNKLFKAIEVFINCFLCCVTNLRALKEGTAEPSPTLGLQPATQCVSAILGVYLNGTVTQVAVRRSSAQDPADPADIACFLRTSSQTVSTALQAERVIDGMSRCRRERP
jgi:hypothetical protein